MTELIKPETRAWVYSIAIAVIPLLTVLGVLTDDIAGHVMLIIAAVLGVGTNTLARANTPPGAKHAAE